MRTRALTLAVFAVGFIVACSDNPTTSARRAAPVAPQRTNIQLQISLDSAVRSLIVTLFPQGLEDAAGDRWDGVKSKVAAGQTDPSQAKVARSMVINLINWVQQKTSRITVPPSMAPETPASAATRLAEYMALYVYQGPDTPVPPYFPGQDAAFGVVMPTTAASIVTPTAHAGVAVDAGSVSEPTIITIVQNPDEYPTACTGPLDTPYCQYPQFYAFDEFPHVGFLKPVRVAVCHVDAGTFRAPLPGANHDNFRFAHPTPPAALQIPGGAVVGNIEVLPLVGQSFTNCSPNTYVLPTAGTSEIGLLYDRTKVLLSRFASAVGEMIAPNVAHAIDQGGGGSLLSFSPINVVDTTSRPDLGIQNFSASPIEVYPGGTVTVSYDVTNGGTASARNLTHGISLAADTGLTQGATSLTTNTVPVLAPGLTSTAHDVSVTVPAGTLPGTYYIGARVQATGLADPHAANDFVSMQIVVLSSDQTIGARAVRRPWMVASRAAGVPGAQ